MAKTKDALVEELASTKTKAEIEELLSEGGDDAGGEGKKLDETVPGGRYKVGDQVVNAHGEPLKK
jgi:hypothetical protein